MKRFLSFVALAGTSLALMIAGQAREHPALLYAGIVVGSLIGLALLVYLLKFLARLIGKSITSALFLSACAVIVFTLIWHGVIANPIIGISVGLGIGFLFAIALIRNLSTKAHNSVIFGEIFSFLTGYQLKAYIRRHRIVSQEDVETEYADYRNIVSILTHDLGLTKKEAQRAAEYAIVETTLDSPIEDKVQKALQYHGQFGKN